MLAVASGPGEGEGEGDTGLAASTSPAVPHATAAHTDTSNNDDALIDLMLSTSSPHSTCGNLHAVAGFNLAAEVLASLDELDIAKPLRPFGHHYVHRLYASDQFHAGDQPPRRRSASGPAHLGIEPPTWGHPIVETDIRASNAIIHVVDGVLIPDDLETASGGDQETARRERSTSRVHVHTARRGATATAWGLCEP